MRNELPGILKAAISTVGSAMPETLDIIGEDFFSIKHSPETLLLECHLHFNPVTMIL